MDKQIRTSLDFHKALLDAIDRQIAVIDASGEIVYVNKFWIEYGQTYGMPDGFNWLDKNYLNILSVDNKNVNASALFKEKCIRQALSGEIDFFESDYPCDYPTEKRWFMLRIAAMHYMDHRFLVITDVDITQRKIAQEKVEELSVTDPLTGIANRRRLHTFLNNEWQRSLRHHTPISVLVFDVDHFKSVNDLLGHSFGDECLCKVADVMKHFTKRPSDLAARFGGEEFVVVLGDMDLSDALLLANLIREAVMELDIEIPNGKSLTISAGLVSIVPTQNGDGTLLIDWADKALYIAKAKGRNRVEVATNACS